MPPLVSIITPSYNQARYLEATMQSVLQQDYPALEYIVVDGGSSDGSLEIIQKYSPRLTWWISEPDQGQADAINKGFQKATGQILAWLNSDDLYLPGAVSQAVSQLEQDPGLGLVFGNALSADADGYLLNQLLFDDWGLEDLLQFKIICQPAVFMRREALQKVDYLDPEYHFFLDHQLWIRLAMKNRIRHIPAFWAVSRYHLEAKNITMAPRIGGEVGKILDWVEDQPDLARIFTQDRNKILAGAEQITARYLLDGGKPGGALIHYFKAARYWLPSLAGFWHRFLFAGLSLIGLGFMGNWYYHWKKLKQDHSQFRKSLENWPGINF